MLGTVIQFIIFSALTFLIMQAGILYKYNPETLEYEYFELTTMEILLMCSLLCCTDVVAAVACIKYEE